MADSESVTMEEMALAIWALRTGQKAGQLAAPTGEPLHPNRLTQLRIPQVPCEGQAAS